MRQQFSCERLRAARESAGLSRERAAVDVDRSYNSILSYELGRVVPPPEVLSRLADLYGCSVPDFFAVAEAVG